MKNNYSMQKFKKHSCNVLVCALSAVITGVYSTAITHASDIEIYQNPTVKGHTIVMLALDNSVSMGRVDPEKTKSRLNILKESLINILEGVKDAQGNYIITPLPDTTIVGLSTFGTTPRHGKIVVAARPLNQWVIVGIKDHRKLLIEEINNITDSAGTPTSLLYGETVGYLRGNAMTAPVPILVRNDGSESGIHTKFDTVLDSSVKFPLALGAFGGKYLSPMSLLSAQEQQCSSQGIFLFTDGAPTNITNDIAEPLYQNALDDRSFKCEASETPSVYYYMQNVDDYYRGAGTESGEVKEMAYANAIDAQGRIVNSDGGNTKKNVFEDRSAWQCLGAMAKRIAFETNPKNRIYTAIVGFGPDFHENLAQNCRDISGTTYAGQSQYRYCGSPAVTASRGYSNGLNVQNAFSLGELGKGLTSKLHYPDSADTHPANIIPERGGYFDASNGEAQSIVDALSKFVNSMSVRFDTASFGSYIVPSDQLSSHSSSNVFAPQFQPKISGSGSNVQSTQKLWLGNLKKYRFNNLGVIVDAKNVELLATNGLVKSNTKDLWNVSNEDDGANANAGGVANLLIIPNAGVIAHSTVNDVNKINTRPLFTDAKLRHANRVWPGFETFQLRELVSDNALTKVDTQLALNANDVDLLKIGYKRSIYQPYLLAALGYSMNREYFLRDLFLDPTTRWIWDLDKVKELKITRQMGGVLHSDPIQVTTEAPTDENGTVLQELRDSSNVLKASRKDYIVFGTMQGLLHMVDQNTGKEVFSFLPHEILEDEERKQGLLDISNLQDATKHPFYGIDAPWASMVDYEYIEDPNNTFYVTQNGTNKLTYVRKFKAKTANIYGGMRMGGKSYYGLDVKDPTQPKFLFRIDPDNGKIKSSTNGVTTITAHPAIQAMGQSWSKPTLAKVRFNGRIRDVMIVGGGYDYNVYENLNARSTSGDKGAGIYIFDAKTGELIWNARYGTNDTSSTDVRNTSLTYSVVSQIKAFDRNSDGLVDNLYFGDLGGQVFRVDLDNNFGVATNKFGRLIHMADFSAQKQRFYEMPALSIHQESGAKFGVIAIASGNRSFPTNKNNGFDNRVYAIYDKDIASESLYAAGFAPSITIKENELYNWIDINASKIGDLRVKTKRGWYYVLRSTQAGVNETVNTGTVKALNGYTVVAYNDIYSHLYVSLFNPNHPSTQQPNSCVGGITGASVITKFCLPYGICGNTSTIASVDINKKVEFVSKPIDGFSRVNAGSYNNGARNLVTIIPNVGQSYQMTRLFQSRNWREVQ